MQSFIATISIDGAFGTPLKGDTLFGQLCWMLRYRLGEAALTQALEGYTENAPFAILSDAMPHGLVLRPEMRPPENVSATDRKSERKKRYLPLSALEKPLTKAISQAQEAPDTGKWRETVQTHNSISRLTATTGAGNDPFQSARLWPEKPLSLDIHIRLDTSRLSLENFTVLLADIGQWGFGRDASIGLGRFAVEALTPAAKLGHQSGNAWLTLAPCAPQGGDWNTARSFWKPFTRFGRHGAEAAHGAVFKSPVLLADTAALLVPNGPMAHNAYVGRGLGGQGQISRQIPATVHQGYAPAIPLYVEDI